MRLLLALILTSATAGAAMASRQAMNTMRLTWSSAFALTSKSRLDAPL